MVERVLAPFRRFARTASASGIVLLAATAIALGWANSPWAESYHHLWELPIGGTLGAASFRTTLHHVINDGLRAVFFFVVGLGVVIGAELNAALAESGATALKGEVYTGPYTDELKVEEPEPGEDVKAELETGGPQL